MKINVEVPGCTPTRANKTDAGLDLRALVGVEILPGETKLINTGAKVKIPEYFVGLVFARSGMAKFNVSLANCVGVIDSDYRGHIKVMLGNYGKEVFKVEQFDRIAQLVVLPISLPTLEIVGDEDWNDTDRGANGFGSTGVK
jgi:dUTP pyrophosphatase